MIVFKNKGLVDIRAVTTFGVSAKGDNKSAIGFFGTGLKYAIAVTLRNGGAISVYRGLDEYKFRAVKDSVRDKEFDFVYMDELPASLSRMQTTPLGFTTHLGANWKPWQAFREVYCNCLDEGGRVDLEAQPEDGYTTVVVQDFPAFMDAYRDRHNIVLTGEPDTFNDRVKVFFKPSQHVYYRGVRVHELQTTAAFTYDLVQPQTLTEDRTLMYAHVAAQEVANSVLRSTSPAYIERMLRAPRDSWEHRLDYNAGYLDEPSDEFLDLAAELMVTDLGRPFPPSILPLLHRKREFTMVLKPVELDDGEQRQLDFAYSLLARMGYADVDKYPVSVVDTLGPGILGKAYIKDGRIALARRAFEVGTKCVVGTLFEEYLHIAYQYQDESRDFQNFLLDKLITVAIAHHMPGELV